MDAERVNDLDIMDELGLISMDLSSFLHELSSFDFLSERYILAEGYCEIRGWFFTSQQYQQWLKGKPWQLCCYGELRCGKVS